MTTNELIAERLGYVPPKRDIAHLLEPYYDNHLSIERPDPEEATGFEISKTHEFVSVDTFYDECLWKTPRGTDVHFYFGSKSHGLPDWENDKNLWVDKSPVVEYLREKELLSKFYRTVEKRYGPNYAIVCIFLPASDYASEFLEVTG